MLIIHRFCSLTRSFNSLPKNFNFSRLISSSAPTKQDDIEISKEDRKLKFIQLEISLLRESHGRAPDINLIKKHQWQVIMKMKSATARRKYYKYLFLNEKDKENKKMKQQQRKELREHQLAIEPPQENPHISYKLGKTTMLLRIQSPVMDLWRNNRLIRAMQFGEKIIFDCSYDQYMNNREAQNTAKQLVLSFAINRKSRQPFDLHFCNVNFNSKTMKHMKRTIPTMQNNAFPMNFYEGSYLDLFPRKQLIYLTPHCQNVLTNYDPDMIYIIGAMVDKTNREPLSLAKAKELNLKMARLPLDSYLNWGSGGGKSLTLDQMMNILLDLKRTRDWKVALKHVPRRKVLTNEDDEE